MRIHPLALVFLLPAGAAAFAPQASRSSTSTSLNAQNKNIDNMVVKPFMATLAGMTIASQMAFAAAPLPQETVAAPIVQQRSATESSNMLLSAFGAPTSGYSGGSFETLDFSMPSYDESASKPSAEKAAAPAFSSPFGDIKMPGASSESEDTGEDKATVRAAEKKAEIERKANEAEERRAASAADKQAAADRKAAEQADKEAAAQRRADERAAADKAKADESAAADQAKAEKAARREAQLQKQKEATARANEEPAKAAPAAVEMPVFKAPEVKVPEMPVFKAPEVKAPEMPEFKAPEMPEFKAPEMPKFAMPKMDTPKFEVPKFDAPKFEAPKFDSPKFDMPKVDTPKFEAPKFDAPKFEAPKFDSPKFDMPKFDMPKAPKVSMPSYDIGDAPAMKAPSMPAFSVPSFGGGGAAVQDPSLESQEVRDERAKDARLVFLDADKEAKAIEAQARAVRDIASGKKKIAGEFKDDACKTHWGGKILCLRPLNSGY